MRDDGRVLKPGDTVGILGGGQLARMLAMAAASFGLRTHIFAPGHDNPAFGVAAVHTTGSFEDAEALAGFARNVDVVTYEFENVPAATIAAIVPHTPVRPNGRALEISQDRLFEKTFLRDLGLPTAPFASADDPQSLESALASIGHPAVVKTRRLGYDGKGQAVLQAGDDGKAQLVRLGRPSILEGWVDFVREVSVVAARGLDGSFRAFDLCENHHTNHILAATKLPASVKPETADTARTMTQQVAEALDYVGVLTVEFFVVITAGAESLVINELAPRVHNSGHWTIDGAVTSQFAQHIRAVCGWPLGSVRRFGTIVMRNLIGKEADRWAAVLAEEGACLHLYGKPDIRDGRKMGHVTTVSSLPEA